MDTVIFVPDLIEYAFVGVPFQTQNVWEDSIKLNHATFAFIKLLVFAPLFNTPKKACLKAGGNLSCSW